MKSSAATKSGFKLPAINEHRLSVGLLMVLVLCGAGYLIWLGIASFIPEATAARTESRSRIAQKHVADDDWESAIQVYQAMLHDDPENGFAAARIAQARQAEVEATWDRYTNLSDNTGNARAAYDLLAEEKRQFGNAIKSWKRLRDNARYQKNAYQQMASLYGRRSVVLDSSEDVEEAVAILDEMLKNGVTTSESIGYMDNLKPLREHPEYSRLVNEELRRKRDEFRYDLDSSGRNVVRRRFFRPE